MSIISVDPMPGMHWQTADPFLFCAHHKDAYPAGNAEMGPAASLRGRNIGQDFEGIDGWNMYHGDVVPGFPQHPHRGFETVTIVRGGLIDHSDSLGATARFGRGDVQWLTAGKGIVHSEMFPLLAKDKPNPAELFQIWLNLPKKNKLVQPNFSMFWHEKIPKIEKEGAEVTVIAGAFGDKKPLPPPPDSWASQPGSHVAIWLVKLAPGGKITLPAAAAEATRTMYVFDGGAMKVAGKLVDPISRVRLKPDAETLLEADVATEAIVLQGKAIAEPVVQYGPFVMNTPVEIQQAFSEFRTTGFGGWPFKSDAPVHPRETERFAKHADGRVEKA